MIFLPFQNIGFFFCNRLILQTKTDLLIIYLFLPGDKCETEINVCVTDKPCQNGGECVPDVNGDRYTCNCPLGYGGDNCQQGNLLRPLNFICIYTYIPCTLFVLSICLHFTHNLRKIKHGKDHFSIYMQMKWINLKRKVLEQRCNYILERGSHVIIYSCRIPQGQFKIQAVIGAILPIETKDPVAMFVIVMMENSE